MVQVLLAEVLLAGAGDASAEVDNGDVIRMYAVDVDPACFWRTRPRLKL